MTAQAVLIALHDTKIRTTKRMQQSARNHSLFHRILRPLGLAFFLVIIWLLLSGQTKTLLLGLGAGSIIFVVWLAIRMAILDKEGFPAHLLISAPIYLFWLTKEIVIANWDVVLRILGIRPISPTLAHVKATQQTDIGRVMHANSITLTPGTVAFLVDHDEITVHSLSEDAAADLQDGEFDRRVNQAENP